MLILLSLSFAVVLICVACFWQARINARLDRLHQEFKEIGKDGTPDR